MVFLERVNIVAVNRVVLWLYFNQSVSYFCVVYIFSDVFLFFFFPAM